MKGFCLKKFVVFIILTALAFVGVVFYRPYIYSNHIFDYYLADVWPSLFCVPVAYSGLDFFCSVCKRPIRKKVRIIWYCAVGYYCYELLELISGLLLGYGWRFEAMDLVAIMIGTLLTLLSQAGHKFNKVC